MSAKRKIEEYTKAIPLKKFNELKNGSTSTLFEWKEGITNVIVQEKIDGSQFSFSIDSSFNFISKSSGTQNPTGKLFNAAINSLQEIKHLLKPYYTYRAESMCVKTQNRINYSRLPKRFIVLFDIQDENGNYLNVKQLIEEANRLDLEFAKVLYEGILDFNLINDFVKNENSMLGEKVNIEGVVIKQYENGRMESIKVVSEKFIETQHHLIEKKNREQIVNIAKSVCTEARWFKAIQHLREDGKLTNNIKEDIPNLLIEVQKDTLKEEEQYIIDQLMELGISDDKLLQTKKKEVLKATCNGFYDWYLQLLKNNLQ
ncbi:hypothetical protein ABK040_004695 [Willaertia magna]